MTLRGYIVILRRDGTSGSFCDWRADKCIFGSDGSCDVHIKLDAVAPFHCKLERMEDGRVFVESLSKTAKTLLNGVPVTGRTFVAHDSLLTLVDRNFRFLYPENSSYIFERTLSFAKKGVSLSPMLTSSPRCISEVSSFPRVVSSSPKFPLLQSTRAKTPTLSSQRRGLSTRERYGPTPTRSVATPPLVNIKRHSLKNRSLKIGNYSSLVRKRVKAGMASKTPPASGSSSTRRLRSSTSKEETSQMNNSSYYSLNTNQTGQIDLFDVSSKSPNASSTLLLSGESGAKALPNVSSVCTLKAAPIAQRMSSSSPVSQNIASANRKISRNSQIRQSRHDSSALHNSSLAEEAYQYNTCLRVEGGLPSEIIDPDHELAIPQPNISGNHLKESRAVKKGVKFGPSLSPEQFDSRLPPSTPVRRGELPPLGSIRRTCASIVEHRGSASMLPTLNGGRNVSSEHSKPQLASVKMRSKPNLRALSRDLMDSFIDDSTAALKNLANGNLDFSASGLSPDAVAKSVVRSKVSPPKLANVENVHSCKSQIIKNGSNVDIDHEGRSHVTLNLLTPIRTSGPGGSIQTVACKRRGRTKVSSTTRVVNAKPSGRRARSLSTSRLNSQLTPSPSFKSQNASNSQVPFSVASSTLRSCVQRSGAEVVSVSSSSSMETCFENKDKSNVTSGRRSDVRSYMDTPKMQPFSRFPAARRPTRTSYTASSPTLSDTQDIINYPTFSRPDFGPVQSSGTKLGPKFSTTIKTRLSGVRSRMSAPEVRDSSRLPGNRESVTTSRSTLSPRLSGQRELAKPQKATASPVLSGIPELAKTPVSSSRLFAVRKYVRNPSTQASPEMGAIQELTESPELVLSPSPSGARRLVKTPVAQDPANLSHIEALVEASKSIPSPRLSGVRKLIKTPKVITSPKLSGIRKLVKTPKPLPSLRLSGVRTLVETPKIQPSPRLSGVRKSVKTPKSLPSPRLSGVRRLMKTPKIQTSPDMSGIRELLKTPKSVLSPRVGELVEIMEGEVSRSLPKTHGPMCASRSSSSLKPSSLHDLMGTPNMSNPETTSEKDTTSRNKRFGAGHLSPLRKGRRLLKIKGVDDSRALHSAFGEVRQTRSRTKTATGADTSTVETVIHLDVEPAKVQKRKCMRRTKSVPAANMESSAATVIKRRRKQLSPVVEPLSLGGDKIVEKKSIEMGGVHGSKSKTNKVMGSTLSPRHSALESPVVARRLQSENEGKGTYFLRVRSKRVGDRKIDPTTCSVLNASPLRLLTDQRRKGARTIKTNTSTVIGSPISRRKSRAAPRNLPTLRSTTARRGKRTATGGAEVSSSLRQRQMKIRKKVKFSEPEAVAICNEAGTVAVDGATGGRVLTAASGKCRILPKLVSPEGGCVRGQAKQRLVAVTTSLRRRVATSPSLKSIRRGRSKKLPI